MVVAVVDSLFLYLDVCLTGRIAPVPLSVETPFLWLGLGYDAAAFLASPLLCLEILTIDAFCAICGDYF